MLDVGHAEGSCTEAESWEHLVEVVGLEDLADLGNGLAVLVVWTEMV